jgi:hypothetical protein
MGIFRRRPPSTGTPWWWPKKPDPESGRELVRTTADLMPWSRTARLAVRAAERRAERLRAEEEVQRRLDSLDDWSPPASPREPRKDQE